MATPLSASLGLVMKRSQARVLRRSLGLFDFADSFHDFGHRTVLLFRQLIDKLQNLRRRLVLFRIRLQILLSRRESDPPQVMSELGGRYASFALSHDARLRTSARAEMAL